MTARKESVKGKKKFSIPTNNFIFLVAGAAVLFHVLALDVYGICLFFLAAAALFAFTEDTRRPFAIFVSSVFIISEKKSSSYDIFGSDYYTDPKILAILSVLAVLVVAAIIYRIARTKNAFKGSRLFIPIAILGLSFIFSGIGRSYYYQSFLFGLLQAALYLGFYALISGLLHDNRDLTDYVATLFSALALVIAVEMVWLYVDKIVEFIRVEGIESLDVLFSKKLFAKDYIVLGWGVSNVIGETLLLFTLFIPYKMRRSANYGWYTLLWLFCVTTFFFTLNRAGFVCCLPFNIVAFIVAIVGAIKQDKQKWKQFAVGIGAYVILVGIIFLLIFGAWGLSNVTNYLGDYFKGLFDSMKFRYIELSSRDKLWDLAIRYFNESPIVGEGFAKAYYEFKYSHESLNIYMALLHNFIFQTIGSSGFMGVAALLLFIWSLARFMFADYDGKWYYIGYLVSFGLVALLDIIYFMPYNIAYLMIVICAAEKLSPAAEKRGKRPKEAKKNEEN